MRRPVLFVDDSALIRAATTRRLAGRGIEVTALGSLREAEGVDPTRFAAALLDIELGDGFGPDVAARLRLGLAGAAHRVPHGRRVAGGARRGAGVRPGVQQDGGGGRAGGRRGGEARIRGAGRGDRVAPGGRRGSVSVSVAPDPHHFGLAGGGAGAIPYAGAASGVGGATGAALAAMPYAGAGATVLVGAALAAIPYAGAAMLVGPGAEGPEVSAEEGPHPATARPMSAAAAARDRTSSRRWSASPQCGHVVSMDLTWHAQPGQETSEVDMRPGYVPVVDFARAALLVLVREALRHRRWLRTRRRQAYRRMRDPRRAWAHRRRDERGRAPHRSSKVSGRGIRTMTTNGRAALCSASCWATI